MSPEELELFQSLIEMLGQAGEGAFWVLFLWVGKSYFAGIIAAAIIITLGIMIVRLIRQSIGLQNFANEARRAAGIRHSWGEIEKSEWQTVISAIHRGREKEED